MAGNNLIIPHNGNEQQTRDEPPKAPQHATRACGRCEFWIPKVKQCRRLPPQPQVIGMQQGALGQQPIAMAFWPTVGPEEWCGEFVAGVQVP